MPVGYHMRYSVDAHAIGQHLTGNETYIRNLQSYWDWRHEHSDALLKIDIK
jgi:hypothetical protein